jgi:hypothetical protein
LTISSICVVRRRTSSFGSRRARRPKATFSNTVMFGQIA